MAGYYSQSIIMMSSLIASKRASFRNQIRKQELETYFAMKRKLISDQMQVENSDFRTTFQNIIEERDVIRNLNILNALAFEKQISDEFSCPQDSEQLYYDIVGYLLQIMMAHQAHTPQDSAQRIKCLNTILNILADSHCPNSAIAQAICDVLHSIYTSVSLWGLDEEISEVGCLIGNLIVKEAFGREVDERVIPFLMDWIEELLEVKDRKEILESLYLALPRFISSLQARYNLSCTALPELFKPKILSFINITLTNKYLLQSSVPPTLALRVANFNLHLLPIILLCYSQETMERLITYCFRQLDTIRKKLGNLICRLIIRIFTFQGMEFGSQEQRDRAIEMRQYVRSYIVKNYATKLLLFLTLVQMELKEYIFDTICKLVSCDPLDAKYFLHQFLRQGLENMMMKIFEVNNMELNFLFMELVNTATSLGQRDQFERFIKMVEKEQQISPKRQ